MLEFSSTVLSTLSPYLQDRQLHKNQLSSEFGTKFETNSLPYDTVHDQPRSVGVPKTSMIHSAVSMQ